MLDHLGVGPGDKITLSTLSDGRIEVKAATPAGDIADAFDVLKRQAGPSLFIEAMNAIAACGWAGER